MTTDTYVAHVTRVMALPGEADRRLREQQGAARRAARDREQALAEQRRQLGMLEDRLTATLPKLVEQRVAQRPPSAVEPEAASDPVDQLRQLLDHLDAALADVAHTRRALEGEQARLNDERRELESEAKRRSEAQEAERRAAAERARREQRQLLAGLGLLLSLAVLAGLLGAVVPAAVLVVLAAAASGALLWRRRSRRSDASPSSPSPRRRAR